MPLSRVVASRVSHFIHEKFIWFLLVSYAVAAVLPGRRSSNCSSKARWHQRHRAGAGLDGLGRPSTGYAADHSL